MKEQIEITQDGEHAGTVDKLTQAATEGELDINRLGEILNGRYGKVNCYPGEPTDICYPLAWFVALEGDKGRRIQENIGLPWHLRYPRRWVEAYGYDRFKAPWGFASILEHFVRHMQGHCTGTTREAVILTDTWDVLVYERWRGNIERICIHATVECYLIISGQLKRRVF